MDVDLSYEKWIKRGTEEWKDKSSINDILLNTLTLMCIEDRSVFDAKKRVYFVISIK